MDRYLGMISSDWNQCLAPCGPFDVLAYHNAESAPQLERIFSQYTSNAISLAAAVTGIQSILPQPLTEHQMDAYLKHRFETYHGVKEFMRWCREHQILFMINTTGMAGYFQRALASGLLPGFEVLSASPMVRYAPYATDPPHMLDLHEITDKPLHTAAVAAQYSIAYNRIIIMGDSGGDGPHFEWGARTGAVLIGSMVKYSLESYCARHDIQIAHRFGYSYAKDEAIDPIKESTWNFTDLIGVVESAIRSR